MVDTGLQGGDLVAMGAIVNFVALYVMAAPEIKSIEDLRGKPVGVTRFGATTDFGIQMLLKKYGLVSYSFSSNQVLNLVFRVLEA